MSSAPLTMVPLASIARSSWSPNLAAAWGFSSWMKNCFGEADAAIEHAATAMRLSPLDPRLYAWQFYTALGHFCAGRYDDAISWAERSLREQPNFAVATRLAAARATRWPGASRKRSKLWHVCANLIPHFGFPISRMSCRHFVGPGIAPGIWRACGKRGYPSDVASVCTRIRCTSACGTTATRHGTSRKADFEPKAEDCEPPATDGSCPCIPATRTSFSHAPVARQGYADQPTNRAVWSRHCQAHGRWPASPLRAILGFQ